MFHNTPFFELSLVLLTTHAIGLEEATKKISPKMVIFKHVAKGRQWSPRVAKGFQGPRGTQGMGEMSYNQIGHIQVIFLHDIQNRAISPLKSPEIPIKNENLSHFTFYCL